MSDIVSDIIFRSKLFIPTPRPDQVARPHLCKRLDDGIRSGHRLTLLSAPAGSGKTSLLSQWIAQAHRPAAWLSLDAEDNDAARFWAYLTAALQTMSASLRPNQPGLAENTHPLALFNEIAALPGCVLLVLDDFHVITAPAILQSFSFLLEHQPPSLHVILSTRTDPPLPIARLRARGQLTEICADALRFTPAETAAFLNAHLRLNLPPADVEALETSTEGWIAGLQLAALSMQGRANIHDFISGFSGRHHTIYEYLTEEVLQRQPQPVRDFLLATSILDRLCAPLCQALTGHAESRELLDELRRNNLFLIALDDERHWYRYHHLFADLLRHSLQQTCSAAQVSSLHRQASDWFEAQAMLGEAVKHARAAQDFDRAADLAEHAIQSGALDSRLSALPGWVAMLPPGVMRAHPRLQIYQAWALFARGELTPARQMLNDARQALETLPPSSANAQLRRELGELLGTMETLAEGFLKIFEGDVRQAGTACRAAAQKASAAGSTSLVTLAVEGGALAEYHQGRLRLSAQSCQRVIDLGAQDRSSAALSATGYIDLGGIYLEWNDLEAVERCLNHGVALCQRDLNVPVLVDAYLLQSRLCQARDNLAGGWEALQQAEQLGSNAPYSIASFNLEVQRLRLKLQQARLAQTTYPVRQLDKDAFFENRTSRLPGTLWSMQQTLLARVYLAQYRPADALPILDALIGPSQAAGRIGRLIEILFLRALAFHRQGELEAALDALSQSLTPAEPEGYVRVYLDEGAPALALLQLAATRGLFPAYIDRLLAAGTTSEAGPRSPASPAPALVDPLTPTELKVLQLIAAGCSNREIAERLVIALNTVKRHTSSIYSKLGVNSRTQAIICAHQRGLTP